VRSSTAQPLSARPPTVQPSTPMGSVRLPRQSFVETSKRNEITAVTDLAVRRRPWVQTPAAVALIEAAAVKALRPQLDRMASQAVGSGAKAALALARHVCEPPPSRLPVPEVLERKVIFHNPRLRPTPESDTAKIAVAWADSSFATANVKEQKALLASWRADRRDFLRSSGLRRRVLVEEDERAKTIARLQQDAVRQLHSRMELWQREDDAALLIQTAWRFVLSSRRRKRQMGITLRMQGAVQEKRAAAEASAQIAHRTVTPLSSQVSEAAVRKLRKQLSNKLHPTTKPALPTGESDAVTVELHELNAEGQNDVVDILSNIRLSDAIRDISLGLDAVMKPFRETENTFKSRGPPSLQPAEQV